MGKTEKTSGSISIIGGSDGPTSVFIDGVKKKTVRQRVHKQWFLLRKKWYSLRIKPNAHTMNEVIAYIKEKYGFTELEKDSKEYLSQYEELRASLIMRYKPELLGEYAAWPELKSHDEECIREFHKQLEIRQKKARGISQDEFSIDFHVLKKTENKCNMHIDIESNFGQISGGFNGPGKSGRRRFGKIYKDVYRYYGVTAADIANKTERYKDLLTRLAMRD